MVPGDLVAFAGRLADAAAIVQRQWFRAEITVETKPDESPVTIADREAERSMRELIEASFPAHGILGEEFGEQNPDAEFVWVLDPIDGTKSFICGRPQFGTLIGLLHRGQPQIGMIDQSILGERWVGSQDQPTTFNGNRIRTRACASLDQAVLACSSRRMFPIGPVRDVFDSLEARARLSQFNTDCYGYGLLAAGFVDLVVEQDLQSYDYLPILPVLEGSGAIVSDWQGQPVGTSAGGRIVAAGDARVHAEALALLRPLADRERVVAGPSAV